MQIAQRAAGAGASAPPLGAGHLFKTWRKRWFVLDGTLLKYYKAADDGSSSPTLMDLRGSIDVLNADVRLLTKAEADGKSYCFQARPARPFLRLPPL